MGIPQFTSQSQLIGSLAELQAQAPNLIGTITGGSGGVWAASSTYGLTYQGMNRNARKRTFHFVSTCDQALTVAEINFHDSSISGEGNYQAITNGQTVPAVEYGNDGLLIVSSDAIPGLAMSVDTVQIELTTGATPPSNGKIVSVYMTEVL